MTAVFLVHLVHTGPQWDPTKTMEGQTNWTTHAAYMDRLVDEGVVVLGGPLDAVRVVHAMATESADTVLAILRRDPWYETHLRIDRIEPWTIRLAGRRRSS